MPMKAPMARILAVHETSNFSEDEEEDLPFHMFLSKRHTTQSSFESSASVSEQDDEMECNFAQPNDGLGADQADREEALEVDVANAASSEER